MQEHGLCKRLFQSCHIFPSKTVLRSLWTASAIFSLLLWIPCFAKAAPPQHNEARSRSEKLIQIEGLEALESLVEQFRNLRISLSGREREELLEQVRGRLNEAGEDPQVKPGLERLQEVIRETVFDEPHHATEAPSPSTLRDRAHPDGEPTIEPPPPSGTQSPIGEAPPNIQDAVWIGQEPELILRELNYLHEPVNPEAITAAFMRFQVDHGIPGTGMVDGATETELRKQDTAIQEEMASIGFPHVEREANKSEVLAAADQLEQFSSYHGLPTSGVYTDAMRAQAKKDASIRDQIRQIASRTGSPDSILGSTEFPDVVTFFRTKDGVMALSKSDGKVDWWSIHGQAVERYGTGPKALKTFEEYHNEHALRHMSDKIAVVPASYINGMNANAYPGKLIRKYLKGIPEQEPKNHGMKVLLSVSPLLQGRASTKLDKEDGWTEPTESPLLLAKTLQASLAEKAEVFVTNDVLTGIENLNNLPTFTKPQEMAIYVDGKIADRGVVETLFGAIDKTKIQVVAADKATPGQARISLMVGENNANFRDQVLKMADLGIFKEGVLALAKCGEGGEIAFNSEILHRSKARAVIFYDELINIQAVKDVLYEFTKELRENGIPSGDFRTAWLRSVERAAANSRGDYKEQILKLRGVHVQVQERRPVFGDISGPAQA